MSLFISFEGGESCGKTTQAKALYSRIAKLGIPVKLVYEPGGTSVGERVRSILKQEKVNISPLSELFLFSASRAQLVSEVLLPCLSQGKVIISDRYVDSTTAYQGYGRGIDLEIVHTINRISTEGLLPRFTILLDLLPEEGNKRKRPTDYFEAEKLTFHERVREGYLKLARKYPERLFIVDACLSPQEIEEIIWDRISHELPQPE